LVAGDTKAASDAAVDALGEDQELDSPAMYRID
jgi:hypothetical protein